MARGHGGFAQRGRRRRRSLGVRAIGPALPPLPVIAPPATGDAGILAASLVQFRERDEEQVRSWAEQPRIFVFDLIVDGGQRSAIQVLRTRRARSTVLTMERRSKRGDGCVQLCSGRTRRRGTSDRGRPPAASAGGANGSRRQWSAFEGFTHVDARFETSECLLLVEGKRTEAVSASTRWFGQGISDAQGGGGWRIGSWPTRRRCSWPARR